MATLWDQLKSWLWKKKPSSYKIDVDFNLNEIEDSDLNSINILKGAYAGVSYYYTKAGIVEEGHFARLKFGYMIIDPGQYTSKSLETDEKFVIMLGDILTELLMMEEKIEPTRTLYSEESNL
jgi:hypothetical protein